MANLSQPIDLMPAPPRRHPDWIRVRAPFGEEYTRLKGLVRTLDLHTVCEEAMCPNLGECWGAGTLTIMILGDTCTRACRFCAVTTGNPRGIVDVDEPRRVAEAIAARVTNKRLTSLARSKRWILRAKPKAPSSWALAKRQTKC